MPNPDEAVTPLDIRVSDAVLDDLRERLARARFPDQIEGAGWDYGTELGYLRELCGYWREKFDWRKVEEELLRYGHFATTIDGQRLHFLEARSPESGAFPLVLTHGWPGSVLEFLKVLPLLTDPASHGASAADAFHVICPSIPGYGYSGPTHERGWDPQRVAEAEIELMRRLGHGRYGAQGGDWGSLITTLIGRLDPGHCAGIHLNMTLAAPMTGEGAPELTEQEQRWLAEARAFQAEGTGYQAIQGTRPQTLGYGLNDSPVGLAAWIVEKFRAWSDCGGDVESSFTKDELLANVTLYWVTQTINSSARLYYEVRKTGRAGFNQQPNDVPTGVAVFPGELFKAPRAWVEQHYKVTHWSVMPRGGHFAAMEEPELFAEDVRAFFRTVRGGDA